MADNYRMTCFIWAEQVGIVCVEKIKEVNVTYALLKNVFRQCPNPTKDESGLSARSYFSESCSAVLQDLPGGRDCLLPWKYGVIHLIDQN